MFCSEFLQAKVKINRPRTTICTSCEQKHVSGNTLYAGGNYEQQEGFGFSGSFFRKYPIIIDDITKIKRMKKKSTPLLNIYEQKLRNMICDNEYKNVNYKDKTEHDGDNKMENNEKYILTDDIK